MLLRMSEEYKLWLPALSHGDRRSCQHLNMIKPVALPLATAGRRQKQSAFTENRLLFLVGVLVVVLIVTTTDCGPYGIAVFSSCWVVFLLERALLGDTLSTKYLTLPSFFMICYLMALSIPSIWTFTEMRYSIRDTYLLAVESVLVTFPFGVGLANLMFKNPKGIIREYARQPLQRTRENFKFYPAFIILIVSLLPLLTPYFVLARHIQLFEVLKAYPTPINPLVLRFAEGELPLVVQFCFEVARRFVLPFCALYAFFMAQVYTGKWMFMFWCLFLATMGISLLTLDRAEPFVFCVMLVIAYMLKRRLSPMQALRSPKIVIGLALGLVLVGVISVTQYQSAFTLERVIDDVWYGATNRLFISPSAMASEAFTIFDSPRLFAHGKYERIFFFLPGHSYTDSLTGQSLIVAPLTFVGNLWGNWGWTGVILGTIIIGFIYQSIQLTIFIRKSTPLLALQVIMLCNAAWIIWGKALSVMSISILMFGVAFGLFMRGVHREETQPRPHRRPATFPARPKRAIPIDSGA